MKKYLLALMLVLAMAVPSMAVDPPGTGASNIIGGNAYYGDNGGSAQGTGWGMSGDAGFSGTAQSKGFLNGTYGFGSGEVTGDGGSFQYSNIAGAGAWGQSEASATELADGLSFKKQTTTTGVLGGVGQSNNASIGPFISGGAAWATGGNHNEAGYRADSSSSGYFLSGSNANGNSNVIGGTLVGATQGPLTSTAWGVTGNAGNAEANGNLLERTRVYGYGGMETGTYVEQGGSYATTYTNATFLYGKPEGNPTGYGYSSGAGGASGYGNSTITNLPNGTKVNATAFSGSFSN